MSDSRAAAVDLARLADHHGEVVDVDVSAVKQVYRAECACGWSGPVRWSIAVARRDGEGHANGR